MRAKKEQKGGWHKEKQTKNTNKGKIRKSFSEQIFFNNLIQSKKLSN